MLFQRKPGTADQSNPPDRLVQQVKDRVCGDFLNTWDKVAGNLLGHWALDLSRDDPLPPPKRGSILKWLGR